MPTFKKNNNKKHVANCRVRVCLDVSAQFWMESEIILVLGWQGEKSRWCSLKQSLEEGASSRCEHLEGFVSLLSNRKLTQNTLVLCCHPKPKGTGSYVSWMLAETHTSILSLHKMKLDATLLLSHLHCNGFHKNVAEISF